MPKLFGTDGVRGLANQDLSAELVFKLGLAGATFLAREAPFKQPLVLVGRDTRLSGKFLEHALIAGILAAGLDVWRVGILPTPGLAYLVRKEQAAGGVVISASHNPPEYNGIKFFNDRGFKLATQDEEEIERMIEEETTFSKLGSRLGQSYERPDLREAYCQFLTESIGTDLDGLKVALDCGFGATCQLAPAVFTSLSAHVRALNCFPDGSKINVNCGSTNPGGLQAEVISQNLNLGLAYDGDGDRVIAVDEKGEAVDGDEILAMMAFYLKEKGKLKNNKVVATVMSNLGFEKALNENGIKLVRTPVGDRYVLQAMLEEGAVLGGEQSGHIIFLEDTTTGDGLLTSLKLAELLKVKNQPLSELKKKFVKYPQTLKSVRVTKKENWEKNKRLNQEIKKAEESLAGRGRILIRPSGTEPLIRVMIEAESRELAEELTEKLVRVVQEELG